MEITLEKSTEQAGILEHIFGMMAMLDQEYLTNFLDLMQEDESQYTAMGILDGVDYFDNLKDKRARIRRLKSILSCINAIDETAKDIPTQGKVKKL